MGERIYLLPYCGASNGYLAIAVLVLAALGYLLGRRRPGFGGR